MPEKKGSPITLSARFKHNGRLADFASPPRWTVYNSADEEIVVGNASLSGDKWEATFTIPTTYPLTNGSEDFVVQFDGADRAGRSYLVDKELTIVDGTEEFQPSGVIVNTAYGEQVNDSFYVPRPAVSATASILSPTGEPVVAPLPLDLSNKQSDAAGITYFFTLPETDLTGDYDYNSPYQLVIKATLDNDQTTTEVHPLYSLTFKSFALVNSLQMYLDKARLQEVDPAFQWHESDLLHYLQEGMSYVNSVGSSITYWNATTFPESLQPYLLAAASKNALMARHLAEGLNAFEFQGLNTSLSYNRTDILQQHIDMVKELLEDLPKAKKIAVRSSGKGTPPPGTSDLKLHNTSMGLNRPNLVNRGRRGNGYPSFR